MTTQLLLFTFSINPTNFIFTPPKYDLLKTPKLF